MKRSVSILFALFVLALLTTPALAADQITYVSQPDEVYVFLNNIAYVRDEINLPGGVEVNIVLPVQIYPDTLIIRENGDRVPSYRIQQREGEYLLQWTSAGADTRVVTLEYLMNGLSWAPKYDMLLGDDIDDIAETVDFSFFAQIINNVLNMDAVNVHLIAGRVDTSQQLSSVSTITTNQIVAGYEEAESENAGVGAATIQYIYDAGTISTSRGDTFYLSLAEQALAARRLHVWNAPVDKQVNVIYKVRNESDLPFAEGTVRSYQNGIFIGSDFIEVTPIGSEGSVTVGNLQDVRVSRSETTRAIQTSSVYDTAHEVELKLTNFGEEAVTIEVVDREHPDAIDFRFSQEPNREAGNLLRWEVTIEPGETTIITFAYTTR